ncbi:MAG: hypothetical protein FJ333_09195 [Sphingomonadales bacterium]|nr:hypothetical protein [Sphingomonadales bacterium]
MSLIWNEPINELLGPVVTPVQISAIRRCIPKVLLASIEKGYLNTAPDNDYVIIHGERVVRINKAASKDLQYTLKAALNKLRRVSILERFKIPEENQKPSDTWGGIWSLRNPTIQGIRLKIAYNDVMSNERRTKYGMSESDKCEVCGEIETVFHQLFQCRNAKRMWMLYTALSGHIVDISGERIRNMLGFSGSYPLELIKGVIFKFLIQIDRSRHVAIDTVVKQIRFWLDIEQIALEKEGKARLAQEIKLTMDSDALCNFL